jgi:hypothetical protein
VDSFLALSKIASIKKNNQRKQSCLHKYLKKPKTLQNPSLAATVENQIGAIESGN